jgi:hypothetical protein
LEASYSSPDIASQYTETLRGADLFASPHGKASIEVPLLALVHERDDEVIAAPSQTTTATTPTITSTTAPPASLLMGSHPLFVRSSLMHPSLEVAGLMNFSTFPNRTTLQSAPGPLTYQLKAAHDLPLANHGKQPSVRAGKTNPKRHSSKQLQQQQSTDQVCFDRHGNLIDRRGKVTCPCGGRHKADDGSATAKQSWRTHALTKQHQKWLQTSTRALCIAPNNPG